MTTTYSNAKNWLSQASSLANSGLNALIAGKDPGAGYGKATYGDISIMMPAAYSLVRNRNIQLHETISKDGCWVRYVEGSRLDLKDVQFFWGSAALSQADHTLLHDDKAKKAELALESILADLAVLSIPDDMKLSISLSNHNPERWGEEIKRRVEGVHVFEHKHPVSRDLITKKVEINITGIYPEGFGSIAHCLFGEPTLALEESEIAIALDIGSSTWLITVFNGNGAVIDRHLIEGGCGELHSMIAEALDKRNDKVSLLSKDVKHSPSLVNRGILEGTFSYGGNHLTGKKFETEYSQCLDEWWSTRIEKFANFVTAGNYLDRAKYLVAWGGGVGMPVVDQNLADLGFVVLENPQFINALGLKLLTEIATGV
ncbi:ParM/StbA family protein [Calothrix sp. FACHB-1219]|uniref:ParM/StbA family protein n=1 Tax=unclassified Calothrix TaxID=2619626 RepID=UPI001681CB61|nr:MULTISPECIES: ParM/StbA family protein [unclassified Calothrix]MBD2208004.1 ParM/StbA family protein [Calothrix sp. FACHB-168]MBD2222575.1 ParM/StbA family protein [Calothrix sp. FACHB-1219]